MTTLAVNSPRVYEGGDVNEFPVIASDIIYEGAAGGLVYASGHARPLTSADVFCGFAEEKSDNSTGAAAAIKARFKRKGTIKLSVSGAVITDFGQPVYATDDDTFVFLPTGAVFIGFVRHFVSSGVVTVAFDIDNFVDPYAGYVQETFTTATIDKTDTGKMFFFNADAQTMTLLAEAVLTGLDIVCVNTGAYGTVAVSIDPNAADLIAGPDDTGATGGLLVNTKATARRGDFVQLHQTADEGYIVARMKGIWTIA